MVKYNFDDLDAVVSAIPFIVFPKENAKRLILDIKVRMKPNTLWLQVHYAKTLKSLYKDIFLNFTSHFVLWNLPPAYVFECINKPEVELVN